MTDQACHPARRPYAAAPCGGALALLLALLAAAPHGAAPKSSSPSSSSTKQPILFVGGNLTLGKKGQANLAQLSLLSPGGLSRGERAWTDEFEPSLYLYGAASGVVLDLVVNRSSTHSAASSNNEELFDEVRATRRAACACGRAREGGHVWAHTTSRQGPGGSSRVVDGGATIVVRPRARCDESPSHTRPLAPVAAAVAAAGGALDDGGLVASRNRVARRSRRRTSSARSTRRRRHRRRRSTARSAAGRATSSSSAWARGSARARPTPSRRACSRPRSATTATFSSAGASRRASGTARALRLLPTSRRCVARECGQIESDRIESNRIESNRMQDRTLLVIIHQVIS